MSQQPQQRVVQLSAAALAVVLRKDDGDSACTSSGHDVFMDFKSQNLRSFWNKRLVKALSEVYFQGWMENSVLLIQGSGSNLEVLREAWMRRALRSPKGFIIKAVGDLSPVQMSPICQSQFIPLSEVLCSVISDMNIARVMVNQETLINYMMKAHPGMAIPTQEILYNALGALIKERKIYHTGEGYFIVTPQTYFITNNMVKENWWTGDNGHISPPPITYLMSNESCEDASTEVPIMAHCKSCSCFTPQQTAPPSVQEQSITISECTGKSLKWSREHKPTVQHQSTSTAADYQGSEISKCTATSRKDKEKPGRKFGLNLFRRNTGKKENKIKKEYATFSGQFPPEEWPVRDEDDLNNLPRDLEHAIIKRINPELTVDNLVRHTVLMKKLEEKAERVTKALTTDKGMSTEILLPKHRHQSTKASGRRLASKPSRSKRRGPSVKEKQRTKSKDVPCDEDLQGDDLIPSLLRPELVQEEPAHHEECATVDAKFVYKKRIEDPFQSMPGCHTAIDHKEPRRREAKTSRRERAGHRSKSWDPHCVKGITEEVQKPSMLLDRSCEQLHDRGMNLDSSLDAKTIQELPGGFSSFYPENSTLRIEDKIKQKSREFSNGKVKLTNQVLQERDSKAISDQKLGVDLASFSYESTELPMSWPKPTVQCRLSLHLVNSKDESDHCPDLLTSHQQTGSMTSSQHLVNSERVHRNPGHADSEVHTDAEQHIYQNIEDDEDGCSSLCLNEEHVSELVHPGTSRCREPVCFDGNWDSSFIEKNILTLCQDTRRVPQRQHEYRWPQTEHKPGLSHLPADCGPGEKPHHVDEKLNKPSPGHPDPTDTLDISIFDYSQMSDRGSDTETVLKSADDDDDQASHWICHSQDYNPNQPVNADNIQPASLNHCDRTGACPGEITENQSNTADSGIDSPRTRMSLISPNSVILKGLKRRTFLQNIEKLHSKTNGIHPQSSLLQLTPVMNV